MMVVLKVAVGVDLLCKESEGTLRPIAYPIVLLVLPSVRNRLPSARTNIRLLSIIGCESVLFVIPARYVIALLSAPSVQIRVPLSLTQIRLLDMARLLESNVGLPEN